VSSYPLESVLKPARFAADEKRVEPTTPLDPSIVERYAEYLQGRASSRIMAHTITLALFGAILGSVPLLAPNRVLIPHFLGLALLLVGAAAGGYFGYTIGVRRAEGLKLQAAVALHQLQVELMLVQPAVARTIERIGDRAMLSTPPAAAPAVAPPAPAPVAPVAVAPAPAAPTSAAAAPAPAPVPPARVPVAPAPLPAAAARAVAPPAPVAPIPHAPVALPPLSAPAPTHHEAPASGPPVSAAPPAQQPPFVPPLVAAPELPTVPRLVEAPPASPPTMVPPISVER
jgi:hypothetical protein